MKKNLTIFALICVLVCSNCLSVLAAPTSRILSITRYEQKKSNWCWAATAQMLGKYYNSSKSQAKISEYVMGNSTNNSGATNTQVSKAIKYATGKNYTLATPLTYNEIKSFIGNKSMPLGIRMVWSGVKGHILVMSGYNNTGSKVTLVDPASGCGKKSYDYYKLVNGTKIQSGTGYYGNTWVIQ